MLCPLHRAMLVLLGIRVLVSPKANPVIQRALVDPDIGRDLSDRPTGPDHQLHGLGLEFGGVLATISPIVGRGRRKTGDPASAEVARSSGVRFELAHGLLVRPHGSALGVSEGLLWGLVAQHRGRHGVLQFGLDLLTGR